MVMLDGRLSGHCLGDVCEAEGSVAVQSLTIYAAPLLPSESITYALRFCHIAIVGNSLRCK